MRTSSTHYIDGDKEYPRVTSVLSRWYDPSPAFATWVAQEAVRLGQSVKDGEPVYVYGYVWNEREAKFEQGYELVDPMELLLDTKYLTGKAWHSRQAAMDRGSLTNDFIDEWANGLRLFPDDLREWLGAKLEEGRLLEGASMPTPYKCDPHETLMFLSCALKWLSEREPTIRKTQMLVTSEKPMFAGTADALGALDDKIRLFEFKTGSTSRSHALQVCAYAYALAKIGVRTIPTVVYFTQERYREVTITGDERRACLRAFKRNLKDFTFSKQDTPWENGVSVRLTMDDLPEVA